MVSGRFWLGSGGFGSFRVGSDGFGWVRVVSGFINNGHFVVAVAKFLDYACSTTKSKNPQLSLRFSGSALSTKRRYVMVEIFIRYWRKFR